MGLDSFCSKESMPKLMFLRGIVSDFGEEELIEEVGNGGDAEEWKSEDLGGDAPGEMDEWGEPGDLVLFGNILNGSIRSRKGFGLMSS
jgi:hypothetical protein